MPDEPQAAVAEPVQTPLSSESDYKNDLGASSLMERFKQMEEASAPAEPPSPDPKPEPKPDTPVEKPPAEEKPDTPLAEEEDPNAEPTAGPKTEKAKLKWGELRKKADELDKIKAEDLPAKEKAIADLNAKLEELKKHDPEQYQKQIGDMEAKIADYEKRMYIYDVESSPQFEQEVYAPMREIGASIKEIAAAYEIDSETLKDAVLTEDPATQRKRLNELLEGMSPVDQLEVRDLTKRIKEISKKADYLRQNAAEVKKEVDFLKDQETRKQTEERQKRLTAAAAAVQKQFREVLPSVFQDEEFAKQVFASELTTDDPTMTAYNAYAGAALPKLVKANAALQKELADLKAADAKRQQATPKMGGDSPAQPQGTALPEGETMWQRMKAFQAQSA